MIENTMKKKAQVIKKELAYNGYLQLYNFELVIPSWSDSKDYIRSKKREIVHAQDSILVLIYAPLIDSLVMCQEFRPGVYFNSADDDPFILECVSGTVEEGEIPEDTAKKEVYEETGLMVNSVKLIASAYKSPGIMTEKTFIYFAEVAGSPKSGIYGVDDEEIMTCIIPRKKIYQLLDEMKINDGATLIALNWLRAAKNL